MVKARDWEGEARQGRDRLTALPPLHSKQPKEIPWKSVGSPFVVEATGVYLSLEETKVSWEETPGAAWVGWHSKCLMTLCFFSRPTSRQVPSVWSSVRPLQMHPCLSWG